jgi:hypothetical protein
MRAHHQRSSSAISRRNQPQSAAAIFCGRHSGRRRGRHHSPSTVIIRHQPSSFAINRHHSPSIAIIRHHHCETEGELRHPAAREGPTVVTWMGEARPTPAESLLHAEGDGSVLVLLSDEADWDVGHQLCQRVGGGARGRVGEGGDEEGSHLRSTPKHTQIGSTPKLGAHPNREHTQIGSTPKSGAHPNREHTQSSSGGHPKLIGSSPAADARA